MSTERECKKRAIVEHNLHIDSELPERARTHLKNLIQASHFPSQNRPAMLLFNFVVLPVLALTRTQQVGMQTAASYSSSPGSSALLVLALIKINKATGASGCC